MPPKNRKKKSASNPARGVATTSLPSKAKIQEAEEVSARIAAEAEAAAAAAAKAAEEEAAAASKLSTAGADSQGDITLTPEEYAAQLEDGELQAFLEKNGEKVFKEAKRIVTKSETEKRTLRAAGNTGCTSFNIMDWLDEDVVEDIVSRGRDEVLSRRPALGLDQSSYTMEIWKLFHVLSDLGFKESLIKEVIAMGILSPEDALEYLILTRTDKELPAINSSGAATKLPRNCQRLSDIPAEDLSKDDVLSKTAGLSISEFSGPTTPQLDMNEVQDLEEANISSESELEDNFDPDQLVPLYIKYMRKISKITGTWSADISRKSKKKGGAAVFISDAAPLTKERSEQVSILRSKVEKLKNDPLFDSSLASELWDQEIQDEKKRGISRARSRKGKAAVVGAGATGRSASRGNGSGIESGDEGNGVRLSRTRSRASSRASASSQDGGAFGAIFDDNQESVPSQATSSTSTIVRDFGKASEINPSAKKLLEESVTGRYAGAKVKFKDISSSSLSYRSEVYITWPIGRSLPGTFPADIDELNENGQVRTDILYSIQSRKSADGTCVTLCFRMLNVSCPTKVQSEYYLATTAIYRLFPDEKLYLRLNNVWRVFWTELAAETKTENDGFEKDLLKWLRDTTEDVLEASPPIEQKEKIEVVIDDRDNNRLLHEPVEFMTSQQLLDMYAEKIHSPEYQYMLQGRMTLPIWQFRDELLQAVEENQVTIVCGETGCGKSTQLPSYILEHSLSIGQSCRIFVTEPRRISALSLAKRVCEEIGEHPSQIGNRSLVGYSIRLEGKYSSKTRLIYATTGIVMRMLERGNNLKGITHLILDEVHERSIDSDFLLLALRKLLPQRPDLKVVLMSATVDANKFSRYLYDAPVFQIPGRTFPVKTFFLEDAVELTQFIVSEDNSKRNGRQYDEYGLDDLADAEPVSGSNYDGYSLQTRKTMSRFDEWTINYDLILQLIIQIASNPVYSPYSQAILVFLPGINEIRKLYDSLLGDPNFREGWQLHALHSAIATEEQEQAFLIPPEGFRKVVIATNIAETGITIPDVTCVIDTCKSKEMRFDEKRQLSRLLESFISRANAKQRRGRAGRVQEGLCFHLVTKERFNSHLLEQPVPEMLRLSLQDLALRIKICNMGGIEETLSLALDPPSSKNINRAVDSLLEAKALTSNEELTPLGRRLSLLPLDVYLGKLLLLSTLYGCVDVCVTIAAILTSKSPFVIPFGKREEAEAARATWKSGDSDLLTSYYAYCGWRRAVQTKGVNEYEFCRKNFLSIKQLSNIEDLKTQLFAQLLEGGLLELSQEERIQLNKARFLKRGKQAFFEVPERYDYNSKNDTIICSTVAAGFYPKILAKDGKGWRNIVNNQSLGVALGSVNRRSNSSWLSYYNILQASSKFYDAYETSRVDDVALALLCGDADFKLYAGAMIIDGNRIRFVFESWRGMIAIRLLRRRIRSLTSQRWKTLDAKTSDEDKVWFDIAIRALGRGKLKPQ